MNPRRDLETVVTRTDEPDVARPAGINVCHFGDCRETMRRLIAEGVKVQMCVTSPPYWGLRDYGTAKWEGGDASCKHEGDGRYYTEKTAAVSSAGAFSEAGEANAERLKAGRWREGGTCTKCGATHRDAQLGLEPTPEQYVANMVEVFGLVRELLADDGVLFLNLGDSYAGSWGDSGHRPERDGVAGTQRQKTTEFLPRNGHPQGKAPPTARVPGLKAKDMVGIPWMVAFALRADGWYLRSEITWCKKAPMPESVTDRPTSATEKIFLLTKSPDYYYDADAVRNPPSDEFLEQIAAGYNGHATKLFIEAGAQDASGVKNRTIESARKRVDKQLGHSRRHAGFHDRWDGMTKEEQTACGSNMRNYWLLGPAPYPEAHFATFPPEVPQRCILAGSKPGDTVLDPFFGSGTTGQVAQNLGRQWIGIELNPEYGKLQDRRTAQQGLVL